MLCLSRAKARSAMQQQKQRCKVSQKRDPFRKQNISKTQASGVYFTDIPFDRIAKTFNDFMVLSGSVPDPKDVLYELKYIGEICSTQGDLRLHAQGLQTVIYLRITYRYHYSTNLAIGDTWKLTANKSQYGQLEVSRRQAFR